MVSRHGQIGHVVHVTQCRNFSNAVPRHRRLGIGKRMFAGPADIFEQLRRLSPWMFQADQPISTIRRGAKHRIMCAQRPKSLCNMMPPYAGNISPNDASRAAHDLPQHPCHTIPQISAPLRPPDQMLGPNAALQPLGIGGYCQDHMPTRVLHAADQSARLVAKPPRRRRHPDIASQPGLNPAGVRFFDHDDQGGLHSICTVPRCDALTAIRRDALRTRVSSVCTMPTLTQSSLSRCGNKLP